ncbi:hypothetical protein NE542_02695 [Faecalibacillus intestinalis]|jgi:hypothetical protein|uniref:DUF7666 domain-containing protein n=1 Tax=Faecalibacillus intestinalis TaxID=1982626 RepID=A0AAP2UCT1_9FIRM|nr:hypothetical protein [Faecalibacillus intestinalis]RGE92843.1 hypothetical protein DW660_11970 [Coprobacillus sp. AM23-9LB]RGG77670.1 hypothetical protein DWW80_13995 [Coprobacillus sp. AF17-17AC]RGG83196.1 hypothetical protein DWW76_12950 [Coprobacillus sp. AF17-11AC]MCB8591049.1 hypothetical protein [Faecalibacillus intestinalis]MCB8612106.1 hypothetical protein [Faecalibacillus intestinalis]
MSVIGYKGFDSKLRGMGMQFEVGKTFEVNGDPKTVRNGMHFCTEPFGVFDYYPRRCGNRYCVVEALGQISTDDSLNTRASTNKMRIIKEISEDEMVRIQKEYRDSLDKKIRSGIDEFLRADAR